MLYTRNILASSGIPGTEDFTALLFLVRTDAPDDEKLLDDIRAAARDFCNTEEGRKYYRDISCHNFNWGDLELNAPFLADAAMRHHVQFVDCIPVDLTVDHDEQLVHDIQIL